MGNAKSLLKTTTSTMSQSSPATAAELLRAYQKDTFFTQSIHSKLLDIVSELMGPYSSRYEHEMDLMAKLLYLTPTTLCARSTLGEEYCELKAVSLPHRSAPSPLRRGLFVLCAVGVPYALQKLRKTGRTQRIADEWSEQKKTLIRAWNFILSAINKSDAVISFLLKCHLCVFYFGGAAYSLAQRVCGVRYRYDGKAQYGRTVSYSGLGRLLLAQLILSASFVLCKIVRYAFAALSDRRNRRRLKKALSPRNLLRMTQFHVLFADGEEALEGLEGQPQSERCTTSTGGFDGMESEDDDRNVDESSQTEESASETEKVSTVLDELGLCFKNDDEEETERAAPQCVLCLSPRRYPTVTECGHVFCWNCIAEWCTAKGQCPLCKSAITHQKLIRLANMR